MGMVPDVMSNKVTQVLYIHGSITRNSVRDEVTANRYEDQ
jgi:hypothetical protein